MKKTYSNPCVRCGTERVVSKIWEEKIDNSIIVNTETVCPDPECQKKVNSENKRQRDKYTAMKERSEQRAVQRRADKKQEKAVKDQSEK